MIKHIFTTCVLLISFQLTSFSQSQADESVRDSTITSKEVVNTYKKTKSFISHLSFGGSFQASFSDNYTSIGLSPSVLYNFNNGFYAGLGFSYYHTKTKNNFGSDYSSDVYGYSIITLYNLLKVIQLSAEFEQLKVNYSGGNDYWTSGLYTGIAYRARNISIGIRYDLLFDDQSIYGDRISPVVRIYF